jgi:alpha-1,2-mannosyltransferase
MICQSLASIYVAFECIYALPPDCYVDTIGAPFSYLLVKFCTAAKVLAYVHYPIISEVLSLS